MASVGPKIEIVDQTSLEKIDISDSLAPASFAPVFEVK
jgi:hypothetical protein